MNIVRITGLAILVFALAIWYYLNNEDYDFWVGALGGIGAILVITGKINRVR